MQQKCALDLRGGDVLTAGDEDVLAPVDDAEHAVAVAVHDVAGAKPRPGHRPCGRLRVVEIPGEDARTAYPQLAGRLTAEFETGVGIDDPHVHVRVGPPSGAGVRAALGCRQAQHVGSGLGQAVSLGERHTGIRPPRRERRWDRRAADERLAQPSARERGEAGVVDQQPVLGGHPHHRRHTPLGEQLQRPPRLEGAFEDDRRAGPPCQQRLTVPRGDMELRQHREHDVLSGQLGDTGQREVVPEAVRVGEDDALRRGLAAGGVDDEKRIVVTDGPGGRGIPPVPASRNRGLDTGRSEQGRGRGCVQPRERVVGHPEVLVLDRHERGGRVHERLAQFA